MANPHFSQLEAFEILAHISTSLRCAQYDVTLSAAERSRRVAQ